MIDKLKIILKNPKLILYYIDKINLIRISDKLYIKLCYERKMKEKLNLKEPSTFNEKLQWLKLYDRKNIYTQMVDKYEVKKHVASIIGEEYIIPTIGVYNKFEDIDFEKLPNQFVIKCTHDSGSTIICKDKNSFDVTQAKKKLNRALKHNFFYDGREWPYKNVKPRIIIEKYMSDDMNVDLIDYKFMCFNGKPKCSFVCLNRNSETGLNVDFYDINWNKMNFQRHYKNSDKILQKPEQYELMLKLAEKLADSIAFVRVDFYDIKGKIYFGELTFYPGGGYEEFTPKEWDKKMGDMIELPKI